ncbi:phytanoyl-CoA dioxygenase family protein [Nocardia salmonicida]|uniref:phytanoyl-CoA dioxygenase family protein n=1 Tax=Nocardia salmonicida TaxID=53431 RepID=UPI0007A47C84|nr:phytanoyl-CoA dioxygenase family protein [Nocardia salmonicida]
MQLTDQHVHSYKTDGFLVLESVFSEYEVALLLDAMDSDDTDGPHRILDEESNALAALYASNQRVDEFAELIRSPRMLHPARTLVGGQVYIYQFKINVKPAFGRDRVSWHQDYTAWKIADRLPAPRLVNAALLLDEATEFNGPLTFIPGSHRAGILRDNRDDSSADELHLDPENIALRPQHIANSVDKFGMRSVQAPAGSLILFSPEVVHGSAPNMSPLPRRLLIATYNECSNLPRTPQPRASYLVGDDVRPLESPVGSEK